MRRSRRGAGRTSRITGIVLVVIIGTGVFAAVRKLGPDKAEPAAPAMESASAVAAITPPPLVPEPPKVEKQPEARPLVKTQTPAPAPAPAPQPKAAPAPAPTPILAAVTPAEPKAEAPAPVTLSNNPLADGKSLIQAGELVRARGILNAALVADRLTGGDRDTARDLLTKISQQAIFGPRIFKDDPFAMAYTVQPGDRLAKVAATNAVTWELLGRINAIPDARKVKALQTIKLIKGPFHATVSKSKFLMDIYLGAPGGAGSVYVMSFPVGLGKDDSTPPGTWQVRPQSKLKNPTYFSPRGEGVIAADDPKNPLGEFWIGLTGVDGHAINKHSYGIHGTIDAASIGKEESMGCIRMKNEDVAIVYELLVEGKSMVMVKE